MIWGSGARHRKGTYDLHEYNEICHDDHQRQLWQYVQYGRCLVAPAFPAIACKANPAQQLLIRSASMTIASDNVDEDMMAKPNRWDIKFIRNFMIVFGFTSSIFDYLTFGTLLLIVRATESTFQTGWFIESLLTELAITLIVRTRKSIFKSKPSRLLWISTLGVTILAIIIPYLPFSRNYLGFEPLPFWLMLVIIGIALLYAVTSEVVKHFFYRKLTTPKNQPIANQVV